MPDSPSIPGAYQTPEPEPRHPRHRLWIFDWFRGRLSESEEAERRRRLGEDTPTIDT